MRITPIHSTYHLDARTREHHDGSHFQAILEAYMKRAA